MQNGGAVQHCTAHLCSPWLLLISTSVDVSAFPYVHACWHMLEFIWWSTRTFSFHFVAASTATCPIFASSLSVQKTLMLLHCGLINEAEAAIDSFKDFPRGSNPWPPLFLGISFSSKYGWWMMKAKLPCCVSGVDSVAYCYTKFLHAMILPIPFGYYQLNDIVTKW